MNEIRQSRVKSRISFRDKAYSFFNRLVADIQMIQEAVELFGIFWSFLFSTLSLILNSWTWEEEKILGLILGKVLSVTAGLLLVCQCCHWMRLCFTALSLRIKVLPKIMQVLCRFITYTFDDPQIFRHIPLLFMALWQLGWSDYRWQIADL